MTEGEGPGPRLFALLGRPVAHTLSPTLHRAAFRALDVDAAYGALEVADDELAPAMRVLARSGGGGNVTLPHKERAAAALDRPSEAVRATGACNCFWSGPDEELAGDNTDVEGFLGAVTELLSGGDAGLAGRDVLLLGAGGAARAVLHGCLRSGVARVDLLNRTRSRAETVAREVGAGEGRVRVLPGREELVPRYHLAVNATSLGVDPDDPLPLDLSGLELGSVLDLVYGSGPTDWVRHARRLGVPARDGREMLVRQAAASLERWLGRSPRPDVLRRALGREGG